MPLLEAPSIIGVNSKLFQYILVSNATLLSNQTQQTLSNVSDFVVIVQQSDVILDYLGWGTGRSVVALYQSAVW